MRRRVHRVRKERKRKTQKRLAKHKRRLARARKRIGSGQPVLGQGPSVQYEVSSRIDATSFGGVAAVHKLSMQSGLVNNIDEQLQLLRRHRPYTESDHVLNVAYNSLFGGKNLHHIEHLRQDKAYLDALGTEAIPAQSTAGDFFRRFCCEQDVWDLQAAINQTRVSVWQRQDDAFFAQPALIDIDGTVVPTQGECKEGMNIHHQGAWGYMVVMSSLANTREPLLLVTHGANRPSHEGAPELLQRSIQLCRDAGFSDVLLRGDTDYSLTGSFARWDELGVRFVFGYDAYQNLKDKAASLPESAFVPLLRAKREPKRTPQARVKQQMVVDKGYERLQLQAEQVAEFAYQPTGCARPYRMVVLRKNISVHKGQSALFDDIRYLFYITNDEQIPAEQVVEHSRQRCEQENLIEQLKNGVFALRAPHNTLLANWAYMVSTSLAWTLKAWMALWLPISPRWTVRHLQEQACWLRMEFASFCKSVLHLPAQVLHKGRRCIVRLLAVTEQTATLFRLLDAL